MKIFNPKKSKKYTYHILFLLLISVISIFYNYQNQLFFRPQSIHAWRQADCASITLNYYQSNSNFFKPQVHNLTSDKGQSGYCATSEIPILYYSVSLLYRMFGTHEFFIKLINFVILFLGLFYLFKTINYLTNQVFWAISFSVLFFTAPVLIYYGNNFLTNVSALSFAIIGLYFFVRFYTEKKKKLLYKALVFFLLAGMFKITALMIFIAIIAYFMIEQIKIINIKNKIFLNSIKPFILITSFIFLILGAWIYYVSTYNNCHDCYYFSTTIFPIWDMTPEKISNLITRVREFWLDDYFNKSVHILFILMFAFIMFNIKKIKPLNLIILIFLLLQSIVYVLLQFWTFYNHDYYVINQYIVPIFIVIVFSELMNANYKKVFNNRYVKIGFVFFLIFNIYHAESKVSERYSNWKNKYYKNNIDIYSITPYLREIGIKYSDKTIYIPDRSNVSLYLMNQIGWTQYADARFNRGEAVLYNRDSVGVKKSINNGAKYLIVRNVEQLSKFKYLQTFATNLVGKYNNVLIFDLLNPIKNFSYKKEYIDTIFCDAETITNNKFSTSNNEFFLENAKTQSNEKAFKGRFSSKLFHNKMYGMTTIIKDAQFGEGFTVNVWRYGNNDAVIVASGPKETKFYVKSSKVIKKDTISNWENIELDFSIPETMQNKELKIYLYNPNSETDVYFDNLLIRKYKRANSNLLTNKNKYSLK